MNLIPPLLWPYFIYKYGFGFIYSQHYALTTPNGWLTLVIQTSAYIVVISSFFATEDTRWRMPATAFLLVVHRSMIALKYASLSPTEYRRMMTVDEECSAPFNGWRLPTKKQITAFLGYQDQLQLITSWLSWSDMMIEFEVLAAATAHNIDIWNTYFVAKSPESGEHDSIQYERWKLFLDRSLPGLKQPDGSIRISVKDVIFAILSATKKDSSSKHTVLILIPIFSVLNVSIPLYLSGPFSSLSTWGIVFTLTSTFISFIYFAVLQILMYVVFLDVYRRYKFAYLLGLLIREADVDCNIKYHLTSSINNTVQTKFDTRRKSFMFFPGIDGRRHAITPVSSTTSSEFLARKLDTIYGLNVPQLSMDDPHNSVAWLLCRRVLVRFGTRIKFRLDIYIGILGILSVGLLLMLSYKMGIEESSDIIHTSFFPQTVLWIVVLILEQIVVVYTGGMVNEKMAEQRVAIDSHIIQLLHKNTFRVFESDPEKSCSKVISDCVANAEAVREAMTDEDTSHPVRVLGIICEKERAFAMLSSFTVYMIFVLQYTVNGEQIEQ